MKASVDSTCCTGCGICEVVCPEVFRMDGDSRRPLAVVHADVVTEEAVNFCRDARDCCKPGAIALVDDDGAART